MPTLVYAIFIPNLAKNFPTRPLSEVRDVINGHIVLGPQREIQEVKNAYDAYDKLNDKQAKELIEMLSQKPDKNA